MQLPESIAAELEAGGVVIASSARAARTLRKQYGEAQRQRNLAAWLAPEIVHWDSWLEKLWQQEQRAGRESRLLLSPSQEHRLWVRLIRPDIEGQRLISSEGVADLAQEAYSRLGAYRALDFLQGEVFGGPDVESFRLWARAFERQCREHGWLSRSILPAALIDSIPRNHSSLPRRAALIGFDRVTPAQQKLIEVCTQAGCAIQIPTDNLPDHSTEALVMAADPREEISLCAAWARGTLETAAQKGKKIRLAVLVPDVRGARSEIERIFRQELAPDSISVAVPEQPLPFEFSLGSPLAAVPMARAALLLLRWMTDGLRQEELAWLMLSGFLWQEESDLLPMAEFDASLRREEILLPEQQLETYLLQPGWHASAGRGDLRDRLYAARHVFLAERSATASFAEWVALAQSILEAAGWPGARRLMSEDFQVRTKWDQLLESVAALTLEGPPVRYAEFLQVLRREAERTIFSPESQDAPIQILGPFESAGMQFDAVWFLGADDTNWPASAWPHPFLTLNLQAQHGMPHADENSDWELAKLVTERVQRNTARCIFSYAKQDREGKRRLSTALVSTDTIPLPPVVGGAEMRERLTKESAGLFLFKDEQEFAPLDIEEEPSTGIAWPGHISPGGHDVLKRQAACPFQAFARYRLAARELDAGDWGLDPMERGNLVHKVLQLAWGELRDRDSLVQARKDGRLRTMVERHVSKAIQEHGKREHGRNRANPEITRPEDRWSRAYLEAEHRRVVQLVEEWLTYEEERGPFAVAGLEEVLVAHVGSLELKLRADRIDTVNGGRLLIDYKTGKVKTSAWTGDRPDEPQLPLYAAYGDVPDLRGVVLAQVRSGEFRFEGSVASPTLLRTISKPLLYTEELREEWQAVLMAMATQFQSGEAQVDPKHRDKTCKLCSFAGLCRIAEIPDNLAEEEGGPDEE